MRRVLWLLVLLWSVALPAAAVAGRVTVQAGDHLVFTRLVLQGEGRSDWKLGRTAQGYALQVGGAEVAFDLGGLSSNTPALETRALEELPCCR